MIWGGCKTKLLCPPHLFKRYNMANNNIPILSRHIAPVCNSYLEAITWLDTENISDGEIVYIKYKTTTPNYRIEQKKTDIIVALGIGEGKYRILNFNSSSIIWGVKTEKIPTMDMLLHGEQYFYKGEDNKWYLVYSSDGKERTQVEISSKPQSFLDLSTGNIYVTYKDKQVRSINNVYTRAETQAKISTLNFSQKDWAQTDPEKTSYIKNKPLLSELGDLSYTVNKVSEGRKLKYNLLWTPYGSSGQVNRGSITIDANKYLKSGILASVASSDKESGGKFSGEEYVDWLPGDYYLDFTLNGNTDTHVYVLMKALTNIYTGSDSVDIRDNVISVKYNSESGLAEDEIGLTFNLVGEFRGAISAADFRRIRDIDTSPYTLREDLVDGRVVPETSLYTRDFIAPDSDGIEDLNETFNIRTTAGSLSIGTGEARLLEVRGSGNTEQTFFKPDYFLSIGNNAFNYRDETKQLAGKKIGTGSSGPIVDDPTYTLVWIKCIKGESGSGKNNGYVISGATIGNVGYTSSDDPSSISTCIPLTTSPYLPSANGYLLISVLTNDIQNLCVRLKWSGTQDNVFENYQESKIELRRPEENTWGAPYHKIGNVEVYDRWYNDNGFLTYEQAWDKIDLSTIEWDQIGEDSYSSVSLKGSIKEGTSFLLGDVGSITVLNDGTLNSSDAPNSGTLWYELKNKVLYNTEVSCLYHAGDYGTEEFIEGTPGSSSHLYLPNLYDTLRNFRHGLDEKLGKDDIDAEMSDTSENPVAGETIKTYLNQVVSAIGENAIDLSRFDVFGVPYASMNTANCYVISEPGTYKLPLVYGNAIKNGVPNTDSYTNRGGANQIPLVNYKGVQIASPYIETDTATKAVRGLVCWSEVNNNITDLVITSDNVCRYLNFTVHDIPNLNSNALIAIADSNNTIMWSWHIWLVSNPDTLHPEKIKNSITDVTDGGITFNMMPVNLGFVYNAVNSEYGYSPYYQWGRKDPLQRAPAGLICYGERLFNTFGEDNDHSTNKTIENSIQNPNLFFLEYDNNQYYNWMAPVTVGNTTIGSAYNLWDVSRTAAGTENTNSVKSVYDPCPSGWKVPSGNAFRGFTTTGGNTTTVSQFNVIGSFSSGWTYKRYFGDLLGVFFPASGRRYRASGGLGSVSSYGGFWSSASISSASAFGLYFNSGYVYPVGSDYRAFGFSVRPFLE